MNICEHCGIEHDGSYKSGRFCSEKCRYGFSTKEKRKDINDKVSKSYIGRVIDFRTSPFKGKQKVPRETRICINCSEIFTQRINKKQLSCSKSCASSYIQKIRVMNNTHNGFISRKDKTPSWAEQFVIDKLNEMNISFHREFKINRFFGDFAFIDHKIILEIDGKQHEQRIESDKERDSIIEAEGWKVIRIKWKYRDYEYMHNQIEMFIDNNELSNNGNMYCSI